MAIEREAAVALTKHLGPWHKTLWTPKDNLRTHIHEGIKRNSVDLARLKETISRIKEIKRADPKKVLRPIIVKAETLADKGQLTEAVDALHREIGNVHTTMFAKPQPMFNLEHSGATDIGLKRTNNEDEFHIDATRRLFVVADGMGGHSDGKIASELACRKVAKYFDAKKPESLEQSILKAHENLLELNRESIKHLVAGGGQVSDTAKALASMGTTLTALHISETGKAHIAHVGDTRVYLLRGRKLKQLTTDHSLPYAQNMLTQAVGGDGQFKPEVKEIATKHGDVFFMCSDGINKHVKDKEIRDVVKKYAEGKATHNYVVQHLIQLANSRGGKDNSTAIVVKIRHNKK